MKYIRTKDGKIYLVKCECVLQNGDKQADTIEELCDKFRNVMTIQEIIEKANKLVADYFNKHEAKPNAIIMCENDMLVLSTYHNLYVNHTNKIDIHNCRFMGMKVIPVKYGEMEVFELL